MKWALHAVGDLDTISHRHIFVNDFPGDKQGC